MVFSKIAALLFLVSAAGPIRPVPPPLPVPCTPLACSNWCRKQPDGVGGYCYRVRYTSSCRCLFR